MKALNLPPNWTHRHYATVASTMLCCDPFAVEPGHFLLVTADEQTAGRGQRGTHWESTRGENLTFNIGWKAPLQLPPKGGGLVASEGTHWPAANEQFLISEITALAVLNAIEDTLSEASPPTLPGRGFGLVSECRAKVAIKWPNDIYIIKTAEDTLSEATSSLPIGEGGGRGLGRWKVAIKWPNDIYIVNTSEEALSEATSSLPIGEGGGRGSKICGMLLEHSLSGRSIAASIAGIGINVNQASFATLEGREEGRGAPISLRQIVGHEVSREGVLEAFVRHFMEGVALLREGRYDEVESAFTARLYRRTGLHRYRDADGEFLGEFVNIARNGTLTLRKQDGTLRRYAFKEVTYVI